MFTLIIPLQEFHLHWDVPIRRCEPCEKQYVYHHCISFSMLSYLFTHLSFLSVVFVHRELLSFLWLIAFTMKQKIHSSLYLFWYLHLIPLSSLFYKAHVCGCFLSGLWLYIHTGFRTLTTTPQKRTLRLALPSKQAEAHPTMTFIFGLSFARKINMGIQEFQLWFDDR